MEGFIKIHRQIMDSEIFADPEGLKIWLWCIMRASFKKRFIPLSVGKGTTTVEVKRGQFIFGRMKAAEDLGIDKSKVYRWMMKIKDMGMILIESNNQYSIVTICNYDTYQQQEEQGRTAGGQPMNNQRTANEQPVNSQWTADEQPVNTEKKGNKGNNVEEGKEERNKGGGPKTPSLNDRNNDDVSKPKDEGQQTLPLKAEKEKEKNVAAKKRKIEPPAWEDFINYVTHEVPGAEKKKENILLKYKSWLANDWKDGNDKVIKNWKSKIMNTYPHLKEDQTQHNNFTPKGNIGYDDALRNF